MKVPLPPDDLGPVVDELHGVAQVLAADKRWPELSKEQQAAMCVATAVFERLMSQLDDVGRVRLALTIRAYVLAVGRLMQPDQ